MKKNGWGLKEMIILVCVLGGALFLSAVVIQYGLKNIRGGNGLLDKSPEIDITHPLPEPDLKPSYANMERTLMEAAKKYVAKYYTGTLPVDNTYIVTAKSLYHEKLLETLVDYKEPSALCSGYVSFTYNGTRILYIPYLKCQSRFTTPGYLRRLDQ